ncbi:restriction endonuclease subunit S [Brachybacterium tyrofermentans]|uniref:restriction endonuclease subunit S n=1 Tax=Brachybacterium tyrofermentans TaxID=47848 RepID=UPI001868B044|nr:restriction endonuclease subunit S [Brachybacterium tyrofermentans]
MSLWQEFALGDICTLRAGNAFKAAEQGRSEGDMPFIKVSDMNLSGNRVLVQEANNWVTSEQAERLKLKPFSTGTTVFAKIGEALKQNRVRMLIRDTVIDNNMMGAVPARELVEPELFHYLMNTVDFAATATGTALPYLTQSTLVRVPVRIPDRATQAMIGAVLRAIDDLIENSRRRIEVLEEMARAIYREWFVKFRYPGHEDAPMVESALGPIPEGWAVESVDSHVFLQRGFDLPTKDRAPGLVNVMGASGVQGTHDVAKAVGPGVTTGRSGTVGVVHYVPEDFWPLNTSLWVKEFRLATPRFAYFLLDDLDLRRSASGAAVPTLDRRVVHAMPAVCPPADLIAQWDEVVLPMFEEGVVLQRQSTSLVSVRDLLLPKLVAGQIDVSTLDLDAVVSTVSTGESAVA